MWFDVQAALAEIDALPEAENARSEPQPRATRATRATQRAENAVQVAQVARVARTRPAEPEIAAPEIRPQPSAPAAPKAGCMVRLVWSGEWVSADRYAAMSERERLGPQGEVFCGKCWQERDRETALRCLDGVPCQ